VRSSQRAGQHARTLLGKRGEDLACRYLLDLGFEIAARNARVGRLELDIVARRGRLIVFCEVRSRSNDHVMSPAQSIDPRKVERIRRAGAQWLRSAQLPNAQVRFDVASVLFDTPDGRINYLEGAF